MSAPTLEERLAITDLTVAYCWAIDTHDWPLLNDVFVSDATADLDGVPKVGRAAIVDYIAAVLGKLDDSQHIIANHQIDVDGDAATSRCYLHAQHVRLGVPGGDLFVVAGRYEDTLVRRPEGWRISHRRLVVMWRDGNVAVVHPKCSD